MSISGSWINSRKELITFGVIVDGSFRILSFTDENGYFIEEMISIKKVIDTHEEILRSNKFGKCDIIIINDNTIYINKVKYSKIKD